jgi:hypothetical protein
MPQVHTKKVYSKESHSKKTEHGLAPVYSIGIRTRNAFEVVTHMTPELRSHSQERKALLRHEQREAKLLAQGKSVQAAHREAASKDPEWLKNASYKTVWKRLGKKVS